MAVKIPTVVTTIVGRPVPVVGVPDSVLGIELLTYTVGVGLGTVVGIIVGTGEIVVTAEGEATKAGPVMVAET